MGRRASDNLAERLHNLILYLCLALTILSSYIGYKAIRAVDAVEKANEAAFQFGLMIGKSRNRPTVRIPMPPEEETQ